MNTSMHPYKRPADARQQEKEKKHPFVSNKNEIYTMIKITNSGLVLCIL